MIAPDEHLLPDNASPLEKTFAAAGQRIQQIPVPIDLLKRPFEVPLAFLPHLAWEMSVDFWKTDWPEWRKRRIVANSVALHRIKGTLPALKLAASLIGGEVVEAVIPPQKAFALAPRTPEQKRAYLARFAQLRVYLFQIKGEGEHRATYAGYRCVGRGFARPSTARQRYGRKASIVDGSSETFCSWSTLAGVNVTDTAIAVERIVVPAPRRRSEAIVGRMFAGGRSSFAQPLKTESRILTLGVDRTPVLTQNLPLVSSDRSNQLAVVSLKPERVYGRAPAQSRTSFVGKSARRFVAPNSAALRIYDRFYLFDPVRVDQTRRISAGTFVGRTRVAFDAYRAEIRVSFPGTRTRKQWSKVGGFVGGFATQAAGRMHEVGQALRAASALRDKVLFTTKCHRPRALADGIPLDGSYSFGDLIAIA